MVLLVVPALSLFIGSYLDGRGVLCGYGVFIGILLMFILPIPFAVLIAWRLVTKSTYRNLLVVPIILLQFAFVWLFPAGATAQMMGIAHKLKREYSTDVLHATAEQILLEHAAGTLNCHMIPEHDKRNFGYATILVDRSEIPADLQGRFEFVAIVEATGSTPAEVHFAFNSRSGIACNATPRESGFFRYSMASGVHAYRYQRL